MEMARTLLGSIERLHLYGFSNEMCARDSSETASNVSCIQECRLAKGCLTNTGRIHTSSTVCSLIFQQLSPKLVYCHTNEMKEFPLPSVQR